MDYNCHIIYPPNPPTVVVRQWKNKSKYTDLYFVGSKSAEVSLPIGSGKVVYEPIFKDDNIQKILLKVLQSLKITLEKVYPYVWSGETPLRFKIIRRIWEGYAINPFNASNEGIGALPETQMFNNKIVPFDVINFVTYTDFLETNLPSAAAKHYFPNEKDTIIKADVISATTESKLLIDLWQTPATSHRDMIQRSVCAYTRAFLSSVIQIAEPYMVLFDKVHTTELIPFIQFLDDVNNIHYKVYKDHTISPELFDIWTNVELMTPNHSITLYSFLKKSRTSYMKFVFNGEEVKRKQKKATGIVIQVSYFIDTNENIGYEVLHSHIEMVLKDIKKQLSINIDLTIDRLALKTSISLEANDITLADLSAVFTSFPMIFKVPSTDAANKKKNDLLHVQYIRVPRYGDTIDIYDLIKTKLELNIPFIDITTELFEFGIDVDEVNEYITQIIHADKDALVLEKRKKRDFTSLGLLINITTMSFGLNIYINNAMSFEEIQSALFWIRCVVHKCQSAKRVARSAPAARPTRSARSASSSRGEAEQAERAEREGEEEEEEEHGQDNPILNWQRSSSSGGAIGKEHHGLLKDALAKLDPDIFAQSKHYTRICSASALRQPIGMTLLEKKAIDNDGYSDAYDNHIVYGSDPEKPNVYMCPRMYCPVSKVPLAYAEGDAQKKCPKGENPIEMYQNKYWGFVPTNPHYVGFLTKQKGYNNLSIPCCFSSLQRNLPTDINALKKKTSAPAPAPAPAPVPPPERKQSTKVGYIINAVSHLNNDKLFGTIPQSLHELLYADVPYSTCKATVKGRECLLRKGIVKGTDTLMESIAYLFGYSNKADLCKMIRTALDPFTFLTLENGTVYLHFMSSEARLLETQTAVFPALKNWLETHTAYTKRFGLKDLIPYLSGSPKPIPISVEYRIGRQLMIYEAYDRFLAHLEADDEEKSPYILYDLVHHLGAVLIIWNRDTENVATMRCPYMTKNKEWYNGTKLVAFVMVMRHDVYYEPLVIVDQHKNISQKISFAHFDKIEKLMGACPAMIKNEDAAIQNLYSVEKWTEAVIEDSKSYKIQSLMITPYDTVKGCFLKNNMYIDFPTHFSMFSLKSLCERCDIPDIVYWEDIQQTTRVVKAFTNDASLLTYKAKKVGFIPLIGLTNANIKDLSYTFNYLFPNTVYLEAPKIPLIIKGNFIKATEEANHRKKKWEKMKKTLIKGMLDNYDTLVAPILKESRREQLKRLYNAFPQSMVLLEEIKYQDKDALTKAYNDLLFEKPYYRKDREVHEGHKNREWIFSQKVADLDNVKYPSKTYRPRGDPKIADEKIAEAFLPSDAPYPDLLNVTKLNLIQLPNKWQQKKDYSQQNVGVLPTYSKTSLIEVFEWFAAKKGIAFDTEDLKYYLKKQVGIMLEDPTTHHDIFADPSMFTEWKKALGRNYVSVNQMIKEGFTLHKDKLRKLWMTVVSNSPNLMPHDIDMYNISKLLTVNFLILHEGHKTKDGRTGMVALTNASTFIIANSYDKWEVTPIFIFFRDTSVDKTFNIYSILIDVEKRTISYFDYGSAVPDSIKKLIMSHITKKK